ncbi:MAG: hypothetical protein ACYC8T_03820 [Myxococcaceae bacterium]
MKRLALVLAVVAAASPGCGEGGGEGRLGFELFLAKAVPDRVGFLQVALLTKGKSYSCDQVQRNCLVAQTLTSPLVKLTDQSGKEHSALLFPLELDGGSQDLSVSGIPVGQDFAAVVEALTRDSPPRLYGSYCTYVSQIAAGVNESQTVFAKLSATRPDGGSYEGTDGGFSVDCDPRFEK